MPILVSRHAIHRLEDRAMIDEGHRVIADDAHIEHLPLPEQLYLLLTDPNTGVPTFSRDDVGRALGMAVVWEMLYAGSLQVTRDIVEWVESTTPTESHHTYLTRAAHYTATQLPAHGRQLAHRIAEHFRPLWEAVGHTMVHEHLLRPAVQDYLFFFHRQVLSQLTEARRDHVEMSRQMRAVARMLWDPEYDDELAHTHPRLLARIIILDNHDLLAGVLGAEAYENTRHHLASLRAYVRHTITDPIFLLPDDPAEAEGLVQSLLADQRTSIYNDNAGFWVEAAADHL